MTRAEFEAHLYLLGIAAATERMLELRDEIDYQRGLMQTKDLSADRVQTSGVGNPTEQRAMKVLALREELEEKIEGLLEYRVDALRVMDAAKLTPEERKVIHARYFPTASEVRRPPTWEELAERLSYSDRGIYGVRNRALRKMGQILKECSEVQTETV